MKMVLTNRERWLLFWDAIITIGILLLVNWSFVSIINHYVHINARFQIGIFEIKSGLSFGENRFKIWSYQTIVIVIVLILNLLLLIWRLIRRYHTYQMKHIISELHYIADGNFKHKIPYELNNNLQPIIESVNALVDAQIRARKDEDKIERSKNEMITNVSHDLRTPLTSIIGYLGLVENDYDKLTPELVKKYTHTAYEKAVQMKSLVDELFEFTKMPKIINNLNFKKVNLSQLLDQLVASFELEATNKNIKLIRSEHSSDIFVDADADKLARVFMNLIQNALKYGEKASYIKVKAKLFEDAVEIKVSNNGKKIPKDSLKHIFERFYRVDESRNSKTAGNGLGLSIVFGIVKNHNGTIEVSSNDMLTEFVICLPLKQPLKDTKEE